MQNPIQKRRILLLLLLPLAIGAPLRAHAQPDEGYSYLFTQLGTTSLNELNIGYGERFRNNQILEFQLGINYGSNLLGRQCGVFGMFERENARISTSLKGILARSTWYFMKEYGITGMLRYGRGTDVEVTEGCFAGTLTDRHVFDIEVFDIGLLANIKAYFKKSEHVFFLLRFGANFRGFKKNTTYSMFQALQGLPPDENSRETNLVINLVFQFEFFKKDRNKRTSKTLLKDP